MTEENVVDLDKNFMEQLHDAAINSNWIPPEYFVNDYISDAANFLRTGEGIHDTETDFFLSTIINWLERDRDTFREENTLNQILLMAKELRDKRCGIFSGSLIEQSPET